MTKSIREILKRNADSENELNADQLIRDFTSVVNLLNSNFGEKGNLAKAVTTFSVIMSFASAGKHVYDYIRKSRLSGEYTLKVREDDNLFDIAEKWLMDSIPADKKVSVFVHSSRKESGYDIISPDDDSTTASKVSVKTSYDGSIEHKTEIAGHLVKVSTDRPTQNDQTGARKTSSSIHFRTIIFTCSSIEAKEAVLAELETQAQLLRNVQPGFYVSRWGGFERISDVDTRPVESVILKEGQMDRILTELKRFRANKAQYDKVGAPYRKGILLYGPPGTAKTSTAAVIANELRMNLYYLSLRGMDDDNLSSCANRIPKDSLIVLEDIDVATAAAADREEHTEASMDDKVSMSALLNLLDGFQSPPGAIFIMTTNRVESLDEALTRPGRMGLKEELSYLDTYQLRGMLEYFTGSVPDDLPEVTPEDGISPAEIVNVVLNHMPEIEEAGPDIVLHVKQRLLTDAVL